MKNTVKVVLSIILMSVFVAGCGINNASESKSDKNYNVKQEDYISKVLIDGISYDIPQSWSASEYQGNSNIGVGVGYYLETGGEIPVSSSGWIGYDTNNVYEGLELYVTKQNSYENLSSEEVLQLLRESLEESTMEYQEITIGDMKGFQGEEENSTIYAVPLEKGIMLACIVINNPEKPTRHSAEIENVIKSISFDMETLSKLKWS